MLSFYTFIFNIASSLWNGGSNSAIFPTHIFFLFTYISAFNFIPHPPTPEHIFSLENDAFKSTSACIPLFTTCFGFWCRDGGGRPLSLKLSEEITELAHELSKETSGRSWKFSFFPFLAHWDGKANGALRDLMQENKHVNMHTCMQGQPLCFNPVMTGRG